MHKLVILCVFDPKARMPDREEVLRDEFETSGQAELRALRWLMYRPYDIVMLVEIKISECEHCKQPIEEKPGWVRHRWIHTLDGAYACRANGGKTQAEPKQEVTK
jgi:hypothetical protein